jgi:hypothetical protein
MQNLYPKSKTTVVKRALTLAVGMAICAGVVAAPPPPPVYVPNILVTGMNTAIPYYKEQPLKLDGTYFGQAQLGVNSWEHTYEIRNFGNADLHITEPVYVFGWNNTDFVVTQQPNRLVPPGQRTSFTVRYSPSFVGEAYTAAVIVTNDPDQSVYPFMLRGDGVAEPLVGPDLRGDIVYYSKYKCEGIPLLACKMKGRVEVQNLATNYDLSWATVRVYAVNGDVLNPQAHLVAQKTVKNLKAFQPGKKNKAKTVKFTGYVPPGYTHLYAEVVPEDGSEDINYTNNRTAFHYGI